jgi:energy-coupling factor transporter ATP-binding protein EcfA2
MIEVRNLSFSYDGVTQVLKSVDLQLNQGEILTITGPTGSGKSTLAKCLCGFIPRSIKGDFSGALLIDGTDTSELSVTEISKQVSLVQQDPESQICTLKVVDEVAFGPENYGLKTDSIASIIDLALSEVDATHLRSRPTFAISGGEKQRVAIASVLSCQPNYIILDEPSSSLDPKGIFSVRRILSGLKARGVGVICIEHNLNAFVPISDRVLVLSDGKLSDWKPPKVVQEVESHIPSVNKENCLLLMKNANFSYGRNKTIHNIDVGIHEGEIIALMGENGSGKTTLVSLLGGLLAPQSGEIFIGDTRIQQIERNGITKMISVVFQNPNHQIFERSVWKEQILTIDILGCLTNEYLERAGTLLEAAGLNTFRERNPFSLSHGQKRRLNVSSTSVHSPQILLFDEPFIGQDVDGRSFIQRIVVEAASSGGASLVVTHDSDFARYHCNRVIFMENGSILLDGQPEIVFQRLMEMGRKEFVTLEVDES